LITSERVTKQYPDGTVAMDRLDLEVPPGKTTVPAGPSGCWKTTSLRMINRLVEPTTGVRRAARRGPRSAACVIQPLLHHDDAPYTKVLT
jgi:ABC-type proline/glycine betaine transport system ATPase subunit